MRSLKLLFIYCAAISIAFAQETCPCVKTEDGKCWTYESKYLAADLDEAVISFPDLTMLDPPNPVDNDSPNPCVTEECKVCQRAIKQRLCQLGIAHYNSTDLPPITGNVTCTRYNLKHAMDKDWCDPATEESSQSKSKEVAMDKARIKVGLKAVLVGVPKTTEPILGERHTISCSSRGSKPDGEGYISLCSECWTWRKLPQGYYPQYINELVCLDGDHRCLSGYGTCKTGVHTMSVLQSLNGVYRPVTINAASYCECRTTTQSAIYKLVTG